MAEALRPRLRQTFDEVVLFSRSPMEDVAVRERLVVGDLSDHEAVRAAASGVDVVVDPFTLATTSQTRVVLNSLCDVGVRRAESFAAMKDVLTA